MPYQTLNETKGGVTFSSEIFSKFCSFGFVTVPESPDRPSQSPRRFSHASNAQALFPPHCPQSYTWASTFVSIQDGFVRLYDKQDTFRAMPENFVTEIYLGEVLYCLLFFVFIFLGLVHINFACTHVLTPPIDAHPL